MEGGRDIVAGAIHHRDNRRSFDKDRKRGSIDQEKNTLSRVDDRRGSTVSAPAAAAELNFIYAAQHGKLKDVERFVSELHGDINAEDVHGARAIHKAAELDKEEVLHFLLETGKANVKLTDIGWRTALHVAAIHDRGRNAELLLEYHASINACDKRDCTPLITAADHRSTTVAAVLVAKGASLDEVDDVQRSALYAAASHEAVDIMKMLLEAGAQPNSPIKSIELSHEGWTPLHMSCAKGTVGAIKELAKWNANVNARDKLDRTPLQLAIHFGKLAAIDAMLDAGADVTTNAYALLKEAADLDVKLKPLDAMAKLLKRGCNPNAVDSNNVPVGNTFMHYAAEHDKLPILRRVIAHGGDLTITNKDNKSAYDYLAKSHDKSLVVLSAASTSCLSLLRQNNNELWFHALQHVEKNLHVHDTAKANLSLDVPSFVKKIVEIDPTMAFRTDNQDRKALHMASTINKQAIQSVLLWCNRYQVDPEPEHISSSCYVFKGKDRDAGLEDVKVAIKLMRSKDQFLREMKVRSHFQDGPGVEHLVRIVDAYAAGHHVNISTFNEADYTDEEMYPDFVNLKSHEWSEQGGGTSIIDEFHRQGGHGKHSLLKTEAELFYIIVMPQADRNLWTALKQERWAGNNMKEVQLVFEQLVQGVAHMHGQGYVHGDLKPLNIMRATGHWKLIDFDAACEIDKEYILHKHSSAYIPPEAIHLDQTTGRACVKTPITSPGVVPPYSLLKAHPSFDVWSLGCILYQMCNPEVRPLFSGDIDDHLTVLRGDLQENSLWTLHEWTDLKKAFMLGLVPREEGQARNLLAHMLQKDPTKRPTLKQVLGHPFIDKSKKVVRPMGEEPKYDVFLGYRDNSDGMSSPQHHVQILYDMLIERGLTVYWDKKCLEPGMPWEQGFCAGLMSSRTFVPLLSRDAINHPTITTQNFSKLSSASATDNVFLEHRMAIELYGLGYIEKVFPVFIGQFESGQNSIDSTAASRTGSSLTVNTSTPTYAKYDFKVDHPVLPDIFVRSTEEKLRHHLDSQGFLSPLEPNRTVKSVVDAITSCQGAFIQGDKDVSFGAAADSIVDMVCGRYLVKHHQQHVPSMKSSILAAALTPGNRSPTTGFLSGSGNGNTVAGTNVINNSNKNSSNLPNLYTLQAPQALSSSNNNNNTGILSPIPVGPGKSPFSPSGQRRGSLSPASSIHGGSTPPLLPSNQAITQIIDQLSLPVLPQWHPSGGALGPGHFNFDASHPYSTSTLSPEFTQLAYVLEDSITPAASSSSGHSPGGVTPPRRVTATGGGGGDNATHPSRKNRSKSPVPVSSSKATTTPRSAITTTPLEEYSTKVMSSPRPNLGSPIYAEVKEISALPGQNTKLSSSAPAPPPPPPPLRRHKSVWDVDDVLKVFRLGEGFQSMLNNLLQMNNQSSSQTNAKPSKKLHRPPSVQRNVTGSKIDDGQNRGARRYSGASGLSVNTSTRESIVSRDSSRASSRASTPVQSNMTPSRRASRVKALSLGDSPINQIDTDMVSREQVQNALLTQRTPLATPRDHAPLAPITSPHHSTRTSLEDRGALGGGAFVGSNRGSNRGAALLSIRGGFESSLDSPGSPLLSSLKDEDGDGVGVGMGSRFGSRRSSTGFRSHKDVQQQEHDLASPSKQGLDPTAKKEQLKMLSDIQKYQRQLGEETKKVETRDATLREKDKEIKQLSSLQREQSEELRLLRESLLQEQEKTKKLLEDKKQAGDNS